MREGYKKTEIGVIPVEWEVVNFKNFFTSVGAKKYQVQKSKYLKNGKYPIIDQGQKFIVGYSNEDDKVYKNIDGVIVFGDHTRIIKFIDFDFIIGADGTQLLKCIEGINQKYSYYVLSNKKLTNLGYSRHFKLVKEMKFPLPPLKEQQKIANILSTSDKKIEAIDLQIQKAQTLKKGLLQKLLSEGIGHSEFKDSELGRIPVGWEVVKLGDISKIKDGTHFSPKSKSGSCKYVTSKNIKFGYFDETKISYISQEEHNEIYKRCPVKKGQVLLTKDGAKTGNACLNPLDEPFSLLSSVALIDGEKDSLDNEYLLQWLLSNLGQKSLKGSMAGQAITRLTLTKISAHKLIYPPLKEQKQIAQILSTADKKLELLRAKKEKYEMLKKGLLQKLLSGEVRVGCCP